MVPPDANEIHRRHGIDALRDRIDQDRSQFQEAAAVPCPFDPPLDSAAKLPQIRVVPGELPRIVDEAERALISSGQSIFQRAGMLVRPVVEHMPTARGRQTTVVRLKPLCLPFTIDEMARSATFLKLDRQRQWSSRDPPREAAAILLAREGMWAFPAVVGVITAPTLRPDGSLLMRRGYDPKTRLFMALDPQFHLPPVSATPSQGDVQVALKTLRDLLSGFPFEKPADEAVALSGIITTLCRSAMSVAPLHAIRAYTPGTGKSHLVDVATAISTGRQCPVITPGKSEEEMEKRLGALLRDASPVVSLDNVTSDLGGDLLCQITERPVVRVRILGKSNAPEFECRSTLFATGNNLVLVGDMTRRTLLCTLDAVLEQPEKRKFDFDPIERVLLARGTYVAAILTIVRAYFAAGTPRVCSPLGSYDEWSTWVRSPLVWLGLPDPVESMETARAEDPGLADIRELFAHWREELGLGSVYTASQIIKHVSDRDSTMEFQALEFRELLLRRAGQGNEVSSRRFGRWLTQIKGRVVDGCRLEVRPDDKHGNRFSLERSTRDR
jgi:hypothetical protein